MTFFSFQCEHDTDAEIYVKRVKAEPIMNDFFMCVAQLLFSVLALKCGSFLSFSCEKCGKLRWEKIDERKFKNEKMKILWIFQILHEWSCVDFRMNFWFLLTLSPDIYAISFKKAFFWAFKSARTGKFIENFLSFSLT